VVVDYQTSTPSAGKQLKNWNQSNVQDGRCNMKYKLYKWEIGDWTGWFVIVVAARHLEEAIEKAIYYVRHWEGMAPELLEKMQHQLLFNKPEVDDVCTIYVGVE
jgi:hypothetical protein